MAQDYSITLSLLKIALVLPLQLLSLQGSRLGNLPVNHLTNPPANLRNSHILCPLHYLLINHLLDHQHNQARRPLYSPQTNQLVNRLNNRPRNPPCSHHFNRLIVLQYSLPRHLQCNLQANLIDTLLVSQLPSPLYNLCWILQVNHHLSQIINQVCSRQHSHLVSLLRNPALSHQINRRHSH